MPDKTSKSSYLVQAIVFVVLAAGCVLLYRYLTTRKESTSVSVGDQGGLDSASITRWDIIPHGNINGIYTVFKDSDVWRVMLPDHSVADADLAIVKRSLKHFSKFDTAASVHIDKSKWNADGIGDNGTRVIVYNGSRISGSYIIGNLQFVDNYKASYYFRPLNSDSVYLLKETYLDGSLIAPAHSFRKKAMSPVDPQYYKTIRVVSADTNVYYLLENIKGTWEINGRPINQNKVRAYIKMLSLIQIQDFASAQVKNPPDASVTIDTQFGPITLAAAKGQNGTWVMASSVNIGNRLQLTTPQVNAVFPRFGYFMSE